MNITRSASCSIAPESRRSDNFGRLSRRAAPGAAQLRKRDDRDLHFLGQGLELLADEGDFLLAAVVPVDGGVRDLQVIDKDDVDLAHTAFQAPGAAPHVKDIQVGGEVEINIRIVDLGGRRDQVLPEAGGDPPPAELLVVIPLSMLRSRMAIPSWDISREKKPTLISWSMDMFLSIDRARAVLPMEGRPATMIRSEFWKPLVIKSNFLNPEGDAYDIAVMLGEFLDMVHRRVQDTFYVDKILGCAVLAQLEDLLLGVVEDDIRLFLLREGLVDHTVWRS
ncbi:MAG: hypothetical protein U5N26_06065 [Candidatus Marinimicrobia bacterium]|nr:hypothetical protein [Candidatus Neomarinimicrobiota bacterium]